MPSSSLTWLLDVAEPTLPPTPLVIPARENYTETEIGTAVAKLVQDAIRRPYGILGERKTGDAFDDTMDAAAGVFILTPAAPFYVLLLGSRRLSDDCVGVVSDAVDLLDCIFNTGRRVKPLTNITSLGNARTALQALETASSSRQSTFEDISQAPAFQRFDLHTDRFLSDAAGAIKVGTEIAQTPQQARTRLAGLVSAVTSAMEDVQRRVALLEGGIDNYNSLNLPALLTQGVISKAREVLQDRIDQLEDLSPTERLQFLRDTVLDVLAGKAVVRGFGSLSRSGTFVPIEGIGVPFADADHLGTQAVVSSSFLDPYVILTGADELTFTVDGGPTAFTIPLPHSFVARLEGTAAEPFTIDGTNDKLKINVTGSGNVTITLVHGTRSVEQLSAEINVGVGVFPITAEPYFNPEKVTALIVDTQNLVGPVLEFVASTSWSTFGVEIGDKLAIVDGVDAGSIFEVTILSTVTLTATLLSGTASVQTGVSVSVGPFDRFLRIRISDAGTAAAVAASVQISLPTVTNPAAATLGFVLGMAIRCRRTRGEDIVLGINASLTASVDNVARVSAEAVYSGSEPVSGRGDSLDATRVISSLFRATGNVTVGGSHAVFAVAGAASAGVEIGDVVTLRGAPVGSQIGRHGILTAVSDTSVSATMTSTAAVATGVDLEFGLDLDQTRDQILRIEAPSSLAGDYRTLDPESNPSEVVLDRPLPLNFLFGGQGLTFQMSLGALRLDFKSQSTDTDSELSIVGTAASLFFNASPATAVGSTPFLLLEHDPKVLGVGDVLEVYSGQYNSPELIIPIAGFERGQQLIELSENLSNSFLTLDFSQVITTPFARIRKVARNNYDAFKAQLTLWLALPVNQTQYFRDLNRFLNPLIVNENPTLSAVNTAQTHVETLVQALQQLQAILASYQVDVVPQVDTLIDSFLSRGSDRAVDTLLQGQFTEFFGYNSEEVSYLGNTLERMRDVSRLDLPVRRKARKEVIDQEQSLGEFEEPDFEFDQSDTQDVDEPDIPGSFVEIKGGNF
jgi:hypothetical protein